MFKKEKLKDLHYAVSGVLAAAEIAEKSDRILSKYGEKAKIPGFRAGHIPAGVLRQRYGASATEDAVNELMNADLDSFVKDKKIKLAGAPKADLKKFVVGGDAEYELEFDILPELPKIDLEKIALSKKTSAVKDGDIDAAIENIRKNRCDFQKQDENYRLVSGDVAVIDFTGYVGDEKFEGGEAKNHRLTLGGGQFIPGFEDQIAGHKPNDEFDVNVTFPKEYHAADLAGRAARFAVKINEARHPVLPPADDELAKGVGMESVEKLRAHIMEILTKQNDESARAKMRNELLDILADRVKMDLPESLVAREVAEARQNAPKDKEFDEKKERAEAARRVKLGLILAEWGQANDVKISREELQSAIWAEAGRYPNPDDVYDFYNKNPNALSMLNGMLFERKTLDEMIKKCKVRD
ncbi:MAG: trigger factor [Rickettsiales bacterium]|jgi:trigger factor|nr:trigger factor [Rickettsiales bacterium]